VATDSGHKYNPIEKVWWHLRRQAAASRLHGSIDALINAVDRYFILMHAGAAPETGCLRGRANG
jgi:hypothetical protein